MRALLKRRKRGILLKSAAAITNAKSAIKVCQRVIGVETATKIKARTARILMCDGSR
jgi:hypothetical protein